MKKRNSFYSLSYFCLLVVNKKTLASQHLIRLLLKTLLLVKQQLTVKRITNQALLSKAVVNQFHKPLVLPSLHQLLRRQLYRQQLVVRLMLLSVNR